MALINNYYVFVESESITRGVSVTSHPVENGLDITDNVKRNPISLSISGSIVNSGGMKASTIVSAITELHQKGKYVKFQGRSILNNALIISFDTKQTAEINGGYNFDMEIQEVRIAQSAYKASATTSTTTRQVTDNGSNLRYHTVKNGDCLWNIAVKYYGDGTRFTEVYNANKDLIDKRNRKYKMDKYTIYTGQKLLIP